MLPEGDVAADSARKALRAIEHAMAAGDIIGIDASKAQSVADVIGPLKTIDLGYLANVRIAAALEFLQDIAADGADEGQRHSAWTHARLELAMAREALQRTIDDA